MYISFGELIERAQKFASNYAYFIVTNVSCEKKEGGKDGDFASMNVTLSSDNGKRQIEMRFSEEEGFETRSTFFEETYKGGTEKWKEQHLQARG